MLPRDPASADGAQGSNDQVGNGLEVNPSISFVKLQPEEASALVPRPR